MPGVQINELSELGLLDGTESFPLQQSGMIQPPIPGETRRITSQDLAVALASLGGGALSPSQIITRSLPAGLTSNWNPAGFTLGISIIRVTSAGGAAYQIDGLQAPIAPKFVLIVNANDINPGTLGIKDASTSVSSPANQILTPGNATVGILWRGSALLWYDPVSSKWRYI